MVAVVTALVLGTGVRIFMMPWRSGLVSTLDMHNAEASVALGSNIQRYVEEFGGSERWSCSQAWF